MIYKVEVYEYDEVIASGYVSNRDELEYFVSNVLTKSFIDKLFNFIQNQINKDLEDTGSLSLERHSKIFNGVRYEWQLFHHQ